MDDGDVLIKSLGVICQGSECVRRHYFDVTCFRRVSELNEVQCPITHGVRLHHARAVHFPPSSGGSRAAGWGISFSLLHKGEKDQLTKDKKWTVNTLNKAQQEQEPAFSPSLSYPIFCPLHLSQKEGSGLTKCQLTPNVWPLRFAPRATDSDGVRVNTGGLRRIIILLLWFPHPHPSLSLFSSPVPLFCFQWGGFTVQCTFKGWYKMTPQRILFGAEETGRSSLGWGSSLELTGQKMYLRVCAAIGILENTLKTTMKTQATIQTDAIKCSEHLSNHIVTLLQPPRSP